VDVALTLSSAVDWIVAGDEYALAETRLRVVPTGPTLADIRRSRADIFTQAKELKRKRAATAAMLDAEVDDDEEQKAAAAAAAADEKDEEEDDDGDGDGDSDDEKKDDVSMLGDEEGGANETKLATPKKRFKSFAKSAVPKGTPALVSQKSPGSPGVDVGDDEEKSEEELAAERDPEIDAFDREEVRRRPTTTTPPPFSL